MNAATLGLEFARRRKEAGLTQAELARLMGTTQSAISKIESGRTLPTIPLLERLAEATGRPFVLTLSARDSVPGRNERAARVRRALRGYRFNPWERSPSSAEAKTLVADGLTRERFEGEATPRSRGR
jgi:transcriptional regulator with XRE-family HTH domain